MVFLVTFTETVRILYDAYQFANPAFAGFHHTNQILTSIFIGFFCLDILICLPCKHRYFDILILLIYAIVAYSEANISDYEANTFLRVLRGLRILQVFHIIPLISSLSVVSEALINTITTSFVDALIILVLGLFIQGVFGNSLFPNIKGWTNLALAFDTILVYVTGDGWKVYHIYLAKSHATAQLISAILLVINNFIIHNIFVGVICQNVDEASRAERQQKLLEQREAKLAKREIFLKKQKRDIQQLFAHKRKGIDFQTLMKDMVGNLRHDDLVPTANLCENVVWLETFLVTLHYYENTMFIQQQSHFAMAHGLGEYVDRRLMTKQNL